MGESLILSAIKKKRGRRKERGRKKEREKGKERKEEGKDPGQSWALSGKETSHSLSVDEPRKVSL